MTDIVKRLREIDASTMNDAACEIERLQLIVAALEADKRMSEIAEDNLSIRPTLEMHRLRSLIREWVDADDAVADSDMDSPWSVFQRLHSARANLRKAVGR